MGGAKAGIIQNGNVAKVSTPMLPVSIDFKVSTLAAMAVNKMSIVPKIFQP
jgi:hypothetical protein